MLSLVTAAEHQYRFVSAQLDADAALRVSIRDHLAARAVTTDVHEPATARPRRGTMALPFGAALAPQPACATC